MTIRKTADFLLANNNYLILTHRRPDGDTVGSACALCRGLRALGKRAQILPNPELTPRLAVLAEGLIGDAETAGGCVISVDVAAQGLLPARYAHLADETQLSIDHHSSHRAFAKQTLVSADAAACGEVILALLDAMEVPLTEAIAEALYVALSTDTGCFRYGNTTGSTLRAAARCLEAGADTLRWNRVLFLEKSLPRLRLEAYLTQHAEFYREGRTALCLLPDAVLKEFGVDEADLDDISGFPRDIAGVELGMMLRTVSDGTKISLRTYAPWNASDICANWGGGGHPAAAGATLPCGLEEARKTVLETLERLGAI